LAWCSTGGLKPTRGLRVHTPRCSKPRHRHRTGFFMPTRRARESAPTIPGAKKLTTRRTCPITTPRPDLARGCGEGPGHRPVVGSGLQTQAVDRRSFGFANCGPFNGVACFAAAPALGVGGEDSAQSVLKGVGRLRRAGDFLHPVFGNALDPFLPATMKVNDQAACSAFGEWQVVYRIGYSYGQKAWEQILGELIAEQRKLALAKPGSLGPLGSNSILDVINYKKKRKSKQIYEREIGRF